MKYFKLGTTLFAIFALTSGLALLITGWIIAGSSNTKSAEMKYHELVHSQALVSADVEYKDAEAAANGVYNAWYDEWLAANPEPASYVPEHAAWETARNAAKAPHEIEKNTAIATATKNRDDAKADAAAAYDRALLNIKRNFKGTDNGQTFTGTYRAANTLTTVKTTVTEKSGGDDLSSVTYETVLSPAGALLVAGMILTLVGAATGTCMAFTYLGVWEKIIDKSKQPKQPRAPKEPKTPREPKEAKEDKEDKQEKPSVAIKDVTPPAEEEIAETSAPAPEPQPAEPPTPPAQPQPSIYGQQWQS